MDGIQLTLLSLTVTYTKTNIIGKYTFSRIVRSSSHKLNVAVVFRKDSKIVIILFLPWLKKWLRQSFGKQSEIQN